MIWLFLVIGTIQSQIISVNRVRNQENRFANAIGGKRKPFSGASPGSRFMRGSLIGKGIDVESDQVVGEAKRTDKKSMSIKAEWLEQLDRQAMSKGKIPALQIELASVKSPWQKDWVMIPLDAFKRLIELLR